METISDTLPTHQNKFITIDTPTNRTECNIP
jgi:hypothetical protein